MQYVLKNNRLYVDTSVFGGYFDEEFREDTMKLFEAVDSEKIFIVTSEVTIAEIMQAPVHIREFYESLSDQFEIIELNDEIERLSEFYIKEGALTRKYISDAQHIAMATISRVDALISWNFKHMVNFFRIRQYNSVNLRHGFSMIDIRSPKEVLL